MTGPVQQSGRRPSRAERLGKNFANPKFRHAYFARQLKIFLAAQIRALRGDKSQTEFGEMIGKPQSVVSRLERESYGKVNLQTLIDIATKLDIALVVRFVSFQTFLEWTKDYSAEALAPRPYAAIQTEVMPELEDAVRDKDTMSNRINRAGGLLSDAARATSDAGRVESLPKASDYIPRRSPIRAEGADIGIALQ